jgi:hypothetical protein
MADFLTGRAGAMARNISNLVDVLLDRGKLTRSEAIAVALGGAAFALVFCYILVTHLTTAGAWGDWDFFLTLQWAAYHSVRYYHQIPQWNPYTCGGNPLIGNPQSHVLTPWFLFTLLFGPVVGLHLEVIVHSAIAWSGGYVLGRELRMSRLAAICTATTYAGSSWFFLHEGFGQIVFLALAYLPWLLAAGWAAATETGKLRYTIAGGALIALSFFEGGPYPPLFEVLSLAIVLPVLAVMRISVRPLIVLLLIGLFTGGFAAIKYVPAREFVAAHPRPTVEGGDYSLQDLSAALFSRDQDPNHYGPGPYYFFESGAYVGLFSVIALVGLLSPRRAILWVIAATIFFLLARGRTGPSCAWVWLHHLPVYSSTRVPQRYLIPFSLAIGVLAGIGIDVLCENRSIVTLGIAIVLITVGTLDLFLVKTDNLGHALVYAPEAQVFDKYFRQFQVENDKDMFKTVQRNLGVINCYEAFTFNTTVAASNMPGYRGEYHLQGLGSVSDSRWSPNALGFEVDAPAATVLVINQNYDPSWRVTSGAGQAFSQDGLLAVRVPAGKSRIILRYISIAATCGLIITILTAFAAFVLIRWESRRPLRDA